MVSPSRASWSPAFVGAGGLGGLAAGDGVVTLLSHGVRNHRRPFNVRGGTSLPFGKATQAHPGLFLDGPLGYILVAFLPGTPGRCAP